MPQVVGLLVLLAAGQADGETLKQGIVGDEHIEPYNIVIIFMSQARRVVAVHRRRRLVPGHSIHMLPPCVVAVLDRHPCPLVVCIHHQ